MHFIGDFYQNSRVVTKHSTIIYVAWRQQNFRDRARFSRLHTLIVWNLRVTLLRYGCIKLKKPWVIPKTVAVRVKYQHVRVNNTIIYVRDSRSNCVLSSSRSKLSRYSTGALIRTNIYIDTGLEVTVSAAVKRRAQCTWHTYIKHNIT